MPVRPATPECRIPTHRVLMNDDGRPIRQCWLILFCISALLSGFPAHAQQSYLQPSPEIREILEAPALPTVHVAPGGEKAALISRPGMLTLRDIAQPRLHLAGYRINPRTNGPALSREAPADNLAITRVEDGHKIEIELPQGASFDYVTWSPRGDVLSLAVLTDDGYRPWIADAESGAARPLDDRRLNATGGNPCQWLDEGRTLLCAFIPDGRGEAPDRAPVPEFPGIHVSSGDPAPVRTFQDLLQGAHDANLFDYYFTSQLRRIAVETGESAAVGAPAIFDQVAPSPDGQYLFVSRTVGPYSYIVPDRWRDNDWFPREMEVWDRSGNRAAFIAELPLEEEVAVYDVRSGPRDVHWRPGEGAALAWVERSLDEGKNGRDVVYLLTDFAGARAEPILELEDYYNRMEWTSDGRALVTEIDRFPMRAASWTRSWLIDPQNPDAEPRAIWDRSAEERFGDPGRPLTSGRSLVQDGEWVYLRGDGITRDGEQPFIDRINLATLETERIWESSASLFEYPVQVIGNARDRVLLRRESRDLPPNFVVAPIAGGEGVALTNLPDPAPQLRDVERRVLVYEREDGVQLAGTVYLPPGWDGQERLPTVLWAYPREFVSADAAGQVPAQDNRFTRIGGASHMFFLLEGYAVFDGPSIAILGGETANDHYVEQLVSSTGAAVDAIVDAGIADRDRIGVGGHSYGGFMTANLLAHSDLFAAGIARSAAFNRTLTPFGFQNERRTLWEAQDVYTQMSPYLHVHQIEAPLLLIHGADDANPGTFPMQSERMFQAMRGLGKEARLVMLDYEDHGYGAQESVYHAVAEMLAWFDEHVKNRTRTSRTTIGPD